MHDPSLVHVRDSVTYLREVFPDDSFIEAHATLLRLAQLPLEVAGSGPLKDDNQVVVRDETVHIADDIWMVQGLQKPHFFERFVPANAHRERRSSRRRRTR